MFSLTRLTLVIVGIAALSIASASAQSTQKKETVATGGTVTTMTQLKGELVAVGPNWIVVKMAPAGDYRVFDVRPDATATIDGTKKGLSQLKIGTMLTADSVVTEKALANRTTTTTKGKVFWASPKSIIVTLENGENKQYAVPPGFKFTVEGKQLGAEELRAGMYLVGTNIVEEPHTTISGQTVVTGTERK